MSNVELWTDGSCDNTNGVGGWGTIIVVGDTVLERFGASSETTSNRMELTAVIKGLATIKTPSVVKVYTDSRYVSNGLRKGGWLDRGTTVKNHDLWVKAMKLVDSHVYVKPIWVRGHSGIELNESADKLAGRARKKLLSRLG